MEVRKILDKKLADGVITELEYNMMLDQTNRAVWVQYLSMRLYK